MTQGRWPTNVILAPDMAVILDQQSGVTKSASALMGRRHGLFQLDGFHTVDELREAAVRGGKTPKGRDAAATLRRYEAEEPSVRGHDDEGGASRFFTHAWYEPEELAWIYEVGLTPYGQE